MLTEKDVKETKTVQKGAFGKAKFLKYRECKNNKTHRRVNGVCKKCGSVRA